MARLAVLGWCWLVLIGLAVVLQSWLHARRSICEHLGRGCSQCRGHNYCTIGGRRLGAWDLVDHWKHCRSGSSRCILRLEIVSGAERPVWRWLTFGETSRLLSQHRRFPQFSLPFTVLSLMRDRAPIFIIGAFSPPALVGLYSQAWRLTHFPSGLTSAALRPVFFHRTATEGLAAQGKAVDRFVRWLLLASSPWIGFVAFGNDALFNLLLGESMAGRGSFGGGSGVARCVVHHHQLDGSPARCDRPAGRKSQGRSGRGSRFCWSPLAGARGRRSLTLAVLLQSGALVLSYVGFIWICYGIAGWPRSASGDFAMCGDGCWSLDLLVSSSACGHTASDCRVSCGRSHPLCRSRLPFC